MRYLAFFGEAWIFHFTYSWERLVGIKLCQQNSLFASLTLFVITCGLWLTKMISLYWSLTNNFFYWSASPQNLNFSSDARNFDTWSHPTIKIAKSSIFNKLSKNTVFKHFWGQQIRNLYEIKWERQTKLQTCLQICFTLCISGSLFSSVVPPSLK